MNMMCGEVNSSSSSRSSSGSSDIYMMVRLVDTPGRYTLF